VPQSETRGQSSRAKCRGSARTTAKEIAAHAVSIDTIEALTDLDLFAALSNDTQEATADFAA